MTTKEINRLRAKAGQCKRVADGTVDDKLAAALLAYACELEQRARLIEIAKKPTTRLSARLIGDPTSGRPQ